MDKIISIRELQQNLYKHIKAGEDCVVTAKGKNIFKIVFFVTTSITTATEITTTGIENKPMPDDKPIVLNTLRRETESILQNIQKPSIQDTGLTRCDACRKLRIAKDAVGEFEVIEEDRISKYWLCESHSIVFGKH